MEKYRLQKLVVLLMLMGAALGSCKSKQAVRSAAESSPAWAGTYSGVLPCASCPGIVTILQLNGDLTYRLETTYLEEENGSFSDSGSFHWNEPGRVLTLDSPDNTEAPSMYALADGRVIQLDMEGMMVTGQLADKYVLTPVAPLEEKYWKLVELNGKPVGFLDDWNREPHVRFQSADKRVSGTSGCNSFFGSYALEGENQVVFSALGATKMACPEMWVEQELFQVLDGTVDYAVKGNKLTFSNNTQVLARFESVALY